MVSGANAIGNVQTVLTKDATNDVTLTAQEAVDVGILEVSAVGASGKAIIFPTAIAGKVLIVVNADAADDVTVKVGASGTGVTVGEGKSAVLRCTATDFVRVTADA